MKKNTFLVDFSLLKSHAAFRAVFIARLISVLSFGLLLVAIPIQIHHLTGSSLQVGLAMTMDGIGLFAGLMCGGVLADRFDRRRLILLARALCAFGFLALAANGFSRSPSVLALYLVSAWDGFFSGISMTALMAAIPALVGRERLAAAGALNMLTTRFGAVLAPMLGGALIAAAGVNWNYLLAGIGTLVTLLPLLSLPALKPPGGAPRHPLQALADGFRFVARHSIVGALALLGALQALLASVRVLYPALAEQHYHASAFETGLLYAAVPLGATLGAFTSGWVERLTRPGLVLLCCVSLSALLLILLGQTAQLPLGLLLLTGLGYSGSIAALLQYTLLQRHTPDHMLGRVNSLWSAQETAGDSLGALALGALARVFPPAAVIGGFGLLAALAAALAASACRHLRRLDTASAAPFEPASQQAN